MLLRYPLNSLRSLHAHRRIAALVHAVTPRLRCVARLSIRVRCVRLTPAVPSPSSSSTVRSVALSSVPAVCCCSAAAAPLFPSSSLLCASVLWRARSSPISTRDTMQALAWRTAVRSGRRAAAAAGLASSGPSATAATGTSGGVTNVWSAVFIPSAASTGASAARCSFHSSAHPLRAPASSDHYRTLGVSRTADKSEIKASYYKLAKQHHPDLTGSSNSEQFTRIQSAYEVLGDEKARKEYDARSVAVAQC